MRYSLAVSSTLFAAAAGQLVGTYTTETHPKLQLSTCTAGGSCTASSSTSIVLDSNWRWLHDKGGYTNCYTGNAWNATACPDGKTCAANCALDGADYTGTYGITASGSALTLKLVTKTNTGTNVGSRVYLMASDTKYQMFKLKNKEFTFDVDVSQLPCGLNGALYFVAMDEDGGLSKYPTNKAGAKYGTGYCDAQCPHDIKFISGEANVEGWSGSADDPNAGQGKYGTCCDEMDVWEANSMGSAYTPHPCSSTGGTRCTGADCGDGDSRYSALCDKDGCDFNSYRMGDKSFYGMGKTVDTKQKMTVVTQFVTANGQDTGVLSEIRRVYIQNGKVIQNSNVNIAGMKAQNAINADFCKTSKTAFGDTDAFNAKGGFTKMSKAMDAGMVLALSIWDDHAARMLWLDSSYPTDKDPSAPGIARGECATTSGEPADVEKNSPNSQVTYSNLKIGPIGSTYKA